ncbi:hypothetical protein ALC56_03567 [Trachymyrmex septentrionalis]|uniref:Uncharacterized protein n=1 Tax=Trachymyrmex septentrionalis TaxID=34720 RepID=A0A195FPZ3_9HYME|nr:hypothetical protein ALC56_03567 [Trachymyrmex septentrionalis]
MTTKTTTGTTLAIPDIKDVSHREMERYDKDIKNYSEKMTEKKLIQKLVQ